MVELPADFLVPWERLLLVRNQSAGDHAPPHRLALGTTVDRGIVRSPEGELVWTPMDDSELVGGTRDLRDIVQIATPAQALAYVRLFAAGPMSRCFGLPWGSQVVSRGAAEEALPWKPSDWAGKDDGEFGVVADGEWADAGLPRARAVSDPDGFVVTIAVTPLERIVAVDGKPCLAAPEGGGILVVQLLVTRSGRIVRELEEVVGPLLASWPQLHVPLCWSPGLDAGPDL